MKKARRKANCKVLGTHFVLTFVFYDRITQKVSQKHQGDEIEFWKFLKNLTEMLEFVSDFFIIHQLLKLNKWDDWNLQTDKELFDKIYIR